MRVSTLNKELKCTRYLFEIITFIFKTIGWITLKIQPKTLGEKHLGEKPGRYVF